MENTDSYMWPSFFFFTFKEKRSTASVFDVSDSPEFSLLNERLSVETHNTHRAWTHFKVRDSMTYCYISSSENSSVSTGFLRWRWRKCKECLKNQSLNVGAKNFRNSDCQAERKQYTHSVHQYNTKQYFLWHYSYS